MNDLVVKCTTLIEFEERAASVYLTFARRFAEREELSWFWLEMSMEEKQHAVLLDFCCSERLISGGALAESTLQSLDNLFVRLEKRAHDPGLSMDDAFVIAGELESSEINQVYADVIMPMRGTAYLTRKKVETLISDHLQSLLDGADKFGASQATIHELSQLKAAGRG